MLLRPQDRFAAAPDGDERREQDRGGDPAEHQPRIVQPAGGNLRREQPAVKSDQRCARDCERCPDHPRHVHFLIVSRRGTSLAMPSFGGK